MVAVGIATNQVLNDQVWSWPWFAAAVAFAVATIVINRWLEGSRRPRATLRPDLVDARGRPLLVSEVTPRQLGVHPSRFGRDGDSPYVERDADVILATALREEFCHVVVVQGPRLAGATSTLAQAAQTCLADCRLLAFSDPQLTVAQMVDQCRRWAADGPGAVLWLDDLKPAQLGQLDRGQLDAMPAGLWLLVTVYDKYLKGFRSPEYVTSLLEEKAVTVRLSTVSEREREALRAETAYAALQPVLDGRDELLMGHLMVALDQIQNALIPGRGEASADRVALLRAVTDWYRVAMPAVLEGPALKDLYGAYRREIVGQGEDFPVSATRFSSALSWAVAETSRERPQLVDLEEAGHITRYVPHPLLAVVADDLGQPGAWPVADALWAYADRVLSGDERRDIGYTALDLGAYACARRLLGHSDTEVDPAASFQIADWLRQTAQADGARRWYGKVIGTAHRDQAPSAMVNLAVLEEEQGDLGEARRRLGEAIASGHAAVAPMAMVNLGLLEYRQGNFDEAGRWYSEAARTGHADEVPRALFGLGTVESAVGNVGEARRCYELAVGTGHADSAPKAMVNLGLLEKEQKNFAEARRWYSEAVGTGQANEAPTAMFNLGLLAYGQGQVAEARHWFRQAAGTEHADHSPAAMFSLGLVEEQQDNVGEARRWYREAIGTRHADYALKAMVNLGKLESDLGDLSEARRWYELVIGTGHSDYAPLAMVNLGLVEKEQGNIGQARHWYRLAIGTRHADHSPRAMVCSGVLEYGQGNYEEARRRFGEAIATGHPDEAPNALFGLGVLESALGNIDEARRRLGEAIDSGHAEAATWARQKLRDLGRHEYESRRAEHFGRYGWQVFADPEMMRPSHAQMNPGDSRS